MSVVWPSRMMAFIVVLLLLTLFDLSLATNLRARDSMLARGRLRSQSAVAPPSAPTPVASPKNSTNHTKKSDAEQQVEAEIATLTRVIADASAAAGASVADTLKTLASIKSSAALNAVIAAAAEVQLPDVNPSITPLSQLLGKPPIPPPKAVDFYIGDNTTVSRLIMQSPPKPAFVWNNFNEGFYSLTCGKVHTMLFGKQKIPRKVLTQLPKMTNVTTPKTPATPLPPVAVRFQAVPPPEEVVRPNFLYQDKASEVHEVTKPAPTLVHSAFAALLAAQQAAQPASTASSTAKIPSADEEEADSVEFANAALEKLEKATKDAELAATQKHLDTSTTSQLPEFDPKTFIDDLESSDELEEVVVEESAAAPESSSPDDLSLLDISESKRLNVRLTRRSERQHVSRHYATAPGGVVNATASNSTASSNHSTHSNSTKPSHNATTTKVVDYIWRTYLKMGNTTLRGNLNVTKRAPVLRGLPQFALVHHNDFDQDAAGWSEHARSVCGESNDLFLGGPCKFSDNRASKTFHLPPHRFIRVTARFHFFDKWEGEFGFMKLDNHTVWTHSHHHCPKVFHQLCKGINVCGDDNTSDRLSTLIDVTIPHHLPHVAVTFESSLPAKRKHPCQASYGIDDVCVYAM